MTAIKAFFTKKVIISIVAILVVGGVVANTVLKKPKIETAEVKMGSVTENVIVTGSIKADKNLELGFDRSGKVVRAYKNIGDSVYPGEVIAELSNSSLNLSDAKATLLNEIHDAYTNTDDALHNKADQFFVNKNSTSEKFEVSIKVDNFTHYFDIPTDVSLDVKAQRQKASGELSIWSKDFSVASPDEIVAKTDTYLVYMRDTSVLLDRMSGAMNSFVSSEFAYNDTVKGYKDTISSAREEVLSASASIISDVKSVNDAKDYLSKSVIVSPISGVITKQDAKVGEAVSAGEALVSLISDNAYIEANVSEINIGKVAVGNPVSITFDAFPGEQFTGKVSYVEPGEVLIDGVVNYKVRITLDQKDVRLKTGLTANLSIQTKNKENVLTVPVYAVSKENDKSFVLKQDAGGKFVKTEVEVGIVGSSGDAEIIHGLIKGDVVQLGQ